MEKDFEWFNHWVEKNLGIQLQSYKESQMQRRILNIMNTTGAKNLKEYSEQIQRDSEIKQAFLEHITINVSEFYRNKELFDTFEKVFLKEIVPKFSSIKIWSAACSIGAEPYTLAMILEKNKLKQATILATDLDDKILSRAKQGVYRSQEVRNVPKEMSIRYFSQKTTSKETRYEVIPEIKRKVTFRKHDLLKERYIDGLQVIVCRNVTIYFKVDARDQVYQKFSDALVPGGILFTGATETINYPERIGLRKIDSFIYQKM